MTKDKLESRRFNKVREFIPLAQELANGEARKRLSKNFGITEMVVVYRFNAMKRFFEANDTLHLLSILFRKGLIK